MREYEREIGKEIWRSEGETACKMGRDSLKYIYEIYTERASEKERVRQ